MEHNLNDDIWVASTVAVSRYGVNVNTIAVYACNDREIGRTDRIKKIGHSLFINLRTFSKKPILYRPELPLGGLGNSSNNAEYEFREIALTLGISEKQARGYYRTGMRKIIKLLGSQNPFFP